MSLQIRATPPNLSSAHGDLLFTVVDPAAVAAPDSYPNFKYVADVYTGDYNQPMPVLQLVARLKRVPLPDSGIGIFNIGPVVRNYLELKLNPAVGQIVAQVLAEGDFRIPAVVKFGEEYNATLFLGQLVDTGRFYFNYYNARLGSLANALTSIQDRIASNRPLYGITQLTSLWQFVPYFSTSTNPVSVTIRPRGGGAGFAISFAPNTVNEMTILNLSPTAINANTPGTITAATTSYQVQVGGQFFEFNLYCEPQYQTYPVHFLNQYGGFETKMFSKVSKSNFDITRNSFGKLPYEIQPDGTITYKNAAGVWNETTSTYATSFQENLTLNTDNLTDSEYRWLRDLMVSPLVYVEDNGQLYPVVIGDNTYDQKKVYVDDLTNLTITLAYGGSQNTQYR